MQSAARVYIDVKVPRHRTFSCHRVYFRVAVKLHRPIRFRCCFGCMASCNCLNARVVSARLGPASSQRPGTTHAGSYTPSHPLYLPIHSSSLSLSPSPHIDVRLRCAVLLEMERSGGFVGFIKWDLAFVCCDVQIFFSCDMNQHYFTLFLHLFRIKQQQKSQRKSVKRQLSWTSYLRAPESYEKIGAYRIKSKYGNTQDLNLNCWTEPLLT